MGRIFRAYRILNHLSVDVATGAMVGAWFFAHVFNAAVDFSSLVVLGLSVWIIYTTDHLLDVRRLGSTAATWRHQFHQKHFNVLLAVMMVAAVLNVILILQLPPTVIRSGLFLGAGIGIYLLLQRHLSFMKEFSGALFYTVGVVLLAWASVHKNMALPHYILILHFLITAWVNLLLFSWFDRQQDARDKHISFIIIWGERNARIFMICLFLVCIVITAIQIPWPFVKAALIFFIMDVWLISLLLFPQYFAKHDRFRFVGDAVFFLPLFFGMCL